MEDTWQVVLSGSERHDYKLLENWDSLESSDKLSRTGMAW